MTADAAEEQRVPIRRRLRGKLGTDHAAGTRTIVDHDGLPEPLAERFTDEARNGVVTSAGCKRYDQADRSGRIVLGVRGRREGKQTRQ